MMMKSKISEKILLLMGCVFVFIVLKFFGFQQYITHVNKDRHRDDK